MKVQCAIVTFFIITLFSCKINNDARYRSQILGEWAFEKLLDQRTRQNSDNHLPPPPRGYYKLKGYVFKENGRCENKMGYSRFEDSQDKDRQPVRVFLGTTTKYQIHNDSLKIFNLRDSLWYRNKIMSVVGDTMTLQAGDSIYEIFTKKHYSIDSSENYDEIFVSSSGCFGFCPSMDIGIAKDGAVTFYGQSYNTVSGFYSAKISKAAYLNIEANFQKADIPHLKHHYDADWSDDETISITFVKDHKIVKTITDYGHQAPRELIWAYTPVRFIYQKLKLKPIEVSPASLLEGEIDYERDHKIGQLSKPESFYLITELLKGHRSSRKVNSNYVIEHYPNIYKKSIVHTDGRFYQFQDGSVQSVIDLGYNFFEENNLEQRLEKKSKNID